MRGGVQPRKRKRGFAGVLAFSRRGAVGEVSGRRVEGGGAVHSPHMYNPPLLAACFQKAPLTINA